MKKFLFSLTILIPLMSCTSWKPQESLMLKPSHTLTDEELNVRYFGASTIIVSDGKTSILVDGFFSRPSIGKSIIYGMKPNHERISKFLEEQNIDKVDVMLLSHSHYDHILDSGYVAHTRNAIVYGSKSSINIVNQQKEPLETHIVDNNQTVNAGLFSITFYETPHAPKKNVTKLFEWVYLALSRGLAYRHSGKNFSFLLCHKDGNILVVPSAGYEAGMLSKAKAEVVFLGVGLLGKQSKEDIENYWHETVSNTQANLVIPIHWDNLSGTSLVPTPNPVDNLGKSIKTITELAEKFSGNSVSIKFPPFSTAFGIENSSSLNTTATFRLDFQSHIC